MLWIKEKIAYPKLIPHIFLVKNSSSALSCATIGTPASSLFPHRPWKIRASVSDIRLGDTPLHCPSCTPYKFWLSRLARVNRQKATYNTNYCRIAIPCDVKDRIVDVNDVHPMRGVKLIETYSSGFILFHREVNAGRRDHVTEQLAARTRTVTVVFEL